MVESRKNILRSCKEDLNKGKKMSRVHWLGTGLSSVPGLRKLLTEHHDIFVWNRTIEKAKALVGDLTENIYEFDLNEIEKNISTDNSVIIIIHGS